MGYPLTLLLLHLFIIVFCHDAFLRFLRTCGIFVELSNIQGSFRHTQRSVLVGKSNLKRGEVIELLLCSRFPKALFNHNFIFIKFLICSKNLFLCWGQSVLETFDDTHREYDVAILMWFVYAKDLICNSPDKVGFFLNVDRSLMLYLVIHILSFFYSIAKVTFFYAFYLH